MASAGKRGRAPGTPKAEPWKPPEYRIEDASALQQIACGTASEAQQRNGFRFLVEILCATYDLSYRSSSALDTAFAEGKRFVGLQCVKFANLNLAALRGRQTEQGSAPEPRERENG